MDKPRYIFSHVSQRIILVTNDIANQDVGKIPAWAKAKSVGASIGKLDAEDIRPPEVKLLQATSPETAEQPNARAGCFWLTGQNIDLGNEIVGTPIIMRPTYVIWNPTKSLDSRVPLAVASDAVHWDVPNQVFKVRYPNNPTEYTWSIKRTVVESGLDKFGSSRPEDPKSTPAAAKTFQTLWAFRLPDGRPQLGIITNSRSGIKDAQELFAMANDGVVDHYFKKFRICAVRKSVRPGEYFFGYKYINVEGGVQDEAEGDIYKSIYEKYKKAGFSIDLIDEPDELTPPSAAAVQATHAPVEDPDEIQY